MIRQIIPSVPFEFKCQQVPQLFAIVIAHKRGRCRNKIVKYVSSILEVYYSFFPFTSLSDSEQKEWK